jgi:omega-6 fatty acid desaturase (delta-12 desaturase)
MKRDNQPAPATTWHSIIAKYNQPSMSRSIWQIINSVLPYLALWVIMAFLVKISFWLALPLMILAAGFLTRIFIIFHDCGHGSFFRSKRLNESVGMACGILAFTPYHRWTDSHRTHHQTVGNLDKRGYGDVWTLTVEEYQARSPWQRFIYRLFRHPLFLMCFGGPLMFILTNRFTTRRMTWKQRRNIYFTNIVMLALAAGTSWLIGWQAFLLIQLPIIYIAAIAGVYLFYLQHQYDEVIWTRTGEWDYQKMALHGSSFFKLPAVLRWFSGNIGFHHVHHLGPTIPNYNLPKAHKENPIFQEVKPITFIRSFHSLKLRLWDEQRQKVVSFKEMRRASG